MAVAEQMAVNLDKNIFVNLVAQKSKFNQFAVSFNNNHIQRSAMINYLVI